VQAAASTGATERQTMSLLKTADSAAETKATPARRAGGDSGRWASLKVTQG